jgi:hypothetical protein
MDDRRCDETYDSVQREITELQTKIKNTRHSVSSRDLESLTRQVSHFNHICTLLLRIKKERKKPLDC